MQHINWDNLRFVLTVAKRGTIASAARELGVNRSTVLRRIAAFQDDLNCRIFEPSATGYALTPQAERMIQAAREVENTLYDMQREIAGSELRLEGELRVTTTDSFMVSILGPILADFHRAHPRIVVDVLITNSVLNLDRRDADVAIRPTGSPDPPLVGRRLASLPFGIYASPAYIATLDTESWRDYRWVGMESSLRATPPGVWFDATIPLSQVCFRSDSFVAIKVALENGLGAGLLPCFLAESSSVLAPLTGPNVQNLTTAMWALTHPDLARSARVRAFIHHLASALA